MTYLLFLALIVPSYFFRLASSQQCELYPVRPLGMTDRFNGVKDEQISASSSFSDDTAPKFARLHYSDAFYWDWSLGGAGAWVAAIQDTKQFLEVDFKHRVVINAIATQGRMGSKEFVKDYYMKYADDNVNKNWAFYRDQYGSPYLFDGNTNDTEVKENKLRYPVIARFVRIYPQRWNRLIALRVEFFGCKYEKYTAFFNGQSRIDFRLDLPGRAVQSYKETIRFRFRTKQSHGIILYGDDGQGDNIAIEIINGRLRVGLDLGSHETYDSANTVYAGSLLDDDQWHDVLIHREYKMLNITVDRMEIWKDVKGPFLQLNLNRNLSLGGLPMFTGKRGLTVLQNFTGCLENVYFNGLNMIRDARNMTALGPKVSRVQNFALHGVLGECKMNPDSTEDLITFVSDSWIRMDRGTSGGVLSATFEFRTFQRGGTLLFHQLDPNDVERHVWLGMEKGSTNITVIINYFDKARELYPLRVDYTNESPTARQPPSFSDGEWHKLSIDISPEGIRTKFDGFEYRTKQRLNLPWVEVNYIGGHLSRYPYFIGCMRGVSVNNQFLKFSTVTSNMKEGNIQSGSCQLRDYCTPNPCMHDAPCTPSAYSFECDCSKTGYTGAVCYRPKYATSCYEEQLLLKPHEGRINQKNVTIDLDGPGILKPFTVTCDFTRGGGVWTYVYNNGMVKRRVDGFQPAGSYKHMLDYNGADFTALSEFVRRSQYCQQNINYECHKARLFARPPGGDTTDENRAWGWWIGRRGQPRFYWGGSTPGHRKCMCGLQGNCQDRSPTCNCDGDKQVSQDNGLLTYKPDLPIRGVRFGDTGHMHDDSFADWSVGRLDCRGNILFDNTVTFRKLDASITMKPIWSYTEFSLSFIFKTTQSDGVFFQNIGMRNQHLIEVRLRQSRTVRFLYNVGFGLRVLDLKTTNPFNDNRWHIVRIERNRKEAALVVDENAPRTLREPVDQAFRVFVFDQKLYIGSTTDVTDGYLGCISNFMVNGVILDLRGAVESGSQTYGLSVGCKPKCARQPCLNRGECQEFYSHYYCECGLTPFRGYVCGREVGAAFTKNSMLKIRLAMTGVQNVGTVDEYIQVGFKTRKTSGTLLQISSANKREFIKVMINTQCGITVLLNVGFELREVTTRFKIGLCQDQHHTVIVWRAKEGRVLNIKVDDYDVRTMDFSRLLNADSDTRLDNPEFLYIGRNETDGPKSAFEGCIYRMQFNNFFPLKMAFQKPTNPQVTVTPKDTIFEHRCGIEEVMPLPEIVEMRPFPTIPPNRTRWRKDMQQGLSPSVIAGIVLAVLFFLILLAILIFCRNFTIEKGDYETNEAKGAGMVDHADVAIRFGRTGHPEITGKEWWI